MCATDQMPITICTICKEQLQCGFIMDHPDNLYAQRPCHNVLHDKGETEKVWEFYILQTLEFAIKAYSSPVLQH